uniref:RING-type domain-containing protein n=1 Tax=Chromera velia CCMP2878 TaxID=1169474 RepID=A0A0G4IBR3_9ALVE|eukprot:Cvel_12888.t1-p1 / transcript=Cvel_12888.t1 / gene=Cvel_12888 / organism=Chromera_velia_CCMP2878 / gene_product=hypothetical protein / transcript_product=hypothetical protein / location=Cvel_scaffold861:17460-18488(-) / protein_length=343 / sequence_SO=supercontig / SO=protein_coding / is_pseudo=false
MYSYRHSTESRDRQRSRSRDRQWGDYGRRVGEAWEGYWRDYGGSEHYSFSVAFPYSGGVSISYGGVPYTVSWGGVGDTSHSSAERSEGQTSSTQPREQQQQRTECRCEFCQTRFANHEALRAHNNSGQGCFQCYHCMRIFLNARELQQHKEEYNVWCEVCRRHFKTTRSLSDHQHTKQHGYYANRPWVPEDETSTAAVGRNSMSEITSPSRSAGGNLASVTGMPRVSSVTREVPPSDRERGGGQSVNRGTPSSTPSTASRVPNPITTPTSTEKSHSDCAAPPSSQTQAQADDRLCCVCSERERDVVFFPCRHVRCCSVCSAKLPNRLCPVCREPIKSEFKIFL